MFEAFDIENHIVDLPVTGKVLQTTIFEDDYTASVFWNVDGGVETHYSTRTSELGNLAFTRVDGSQFADNGIYTVI